MKKIIVTLFAILFGFSVSGYGSQTTGVTGTLASTTAIACGNANISLSALTANFTGQDTSNCTVTSNSEDFTVDVTSANSGVLKHGGSSNDTVPYNVALKFGGASVLDAVQPSSKKTTGAIDIGGNTGTALTIDITGSGIAALTYGTYTDTLTFTITDG